MVFFGLEVLGRALRRAGATGGVLDRRRESQVMVRRIGRTACAGLAVLFEAHDVEQLVEGNARRRRAGRHGRGSAQRVGGFRLAVLVESLDELVFRDVNEHRLRFENRVAESELDLDLLKDRRRSPRAPGPAAATRRRAASPRRRRTPSSGRTAGRGRGRYLERTCRRLPPGPPTASRGFPASRGEGTVAPTRLA